MQIAGVESLGPGSKLAIILIMIFRPQSLLFVKCYLKLTNDLLHLLMV